MSRSSSDDYGSLSPEPRHRMNIGSNQQNHTILQNSRACGAYSIQEDLAILDYIEEHNAYSRVGGRALWEEMSTRFTSGRTWQSLKERFRKRIMTSLQSYVAHGLSNKRILKLERSITIKTGSGKNPDQQQYLQKQRLQQQKQSEVQSNARWNHGRKTRKGSSPKSQKMRYHCQQHRASKMESESKHCRGIKNRGKQSSGIQVREHRNNPHQTESEESETEEVVRIGRNISLLTYKPHHSQEKQQKHQQDSHPEVNEYNIMKGKTTGKMALYTAAHVKLKKGKSSASLSRSLITDSNNFKVWKQKVLKSALGSDDISKNSCALEESQESSANSFCPSISRENSTLIHTSKIPKKKCQLVGLQEDKMLTSKTSLCCPSVDLKRSMKMQRQSRQMGRCVERNAETKKQCKRQLVVQKGDLENSDNDRDSQRGECDGSEAMRTRSRTIPRLTDDTDGSDNGSLPDLSGDSPASPYWIRTHSEEEEEEEEEEEDEDKGTSGSSSYLFDIESGSE